MARNDICSPNCTLMGLMFYFLLLEGVSVIIFGSTKLWQCTSYMQTYLQKVLVLLVQASVSVMDHWVTQPSKGKFSQCGLSEADLKHHSPLNSMI